MSFLNIFSKTKSNEEVKEKIVSLNNSISVLEKEIRKLESEHQQAERDYRFTYENVNISGYRSTEWHNHFEEQKT